MIIQSNLSYIMDYGYMLSRHTRYFYVIQCPNSIIFLKFSVLPENRKRGCMLRGSHGEKIALFFCYLIA